MKVQIQRRQIKVGIRTSRSFFDLVIMDLFSLIDCCFFRIIDKNKETVAAGLIYFHSLEITEDQDTVPCFITNVLIDKSAILELDKAILCLCTLRVYKRNDSINRICILF